jgi:uncharacterized protein with HEPN domain
MPSRSAQSALLDIRDNIVLAREFAAGLSLAEFKASRLRLYAVTRALEIVSEAARRLPDDVRSRHPALPWRAIMGVGNVYRHDYDNVAEDFGWRTIQHSLEPLLEAIIAEIDALPDQG